MVTIKIIGKTKDTNDPVFRCNTETSFLEGCICPEGFNIWAIWSNKAGDFKKMMNAIVNEYKKTHIQFVQVISEELIAKLRGFKQKIEIFQPIPEIKEKILVLEGEWLIQLVMDE